MAQERLNSLDRFRKQPEKLVLESYSHCEVPAGCGGAVLRWARPAATLVHLYSSAPAVPAIDGVPLTTPVLDLEPGPHVLTLTLAQVDSSQWELLAVLAARDANHRNEPRWRIRTEADNMWHFTTAAPPAEWTQIDFVSDPWSRLVASTAPSAVTTARTQCIERGAIALGWPGTGSGPLWVRRVFHVTEYQPPRG